MQLTSLPLNLCVPRDFSFLPLILSLITLHLKNKCYRLSNLKFVKVHFMTDDMVYHSEYSICVQ